MRAIAWLLAGLIAALAGAGCGEDENLEGSPDPATERSDRPAKPPPGWRTFSNGRAGFTLSVPPGWTARARKSATLIRSGDRLLAVTIAADRSEPGRTTRPRQYARRTFRALPGFRRLKATGARRVAGSPYASARVDGNGTLDDNRRRQHITVAAFRRPQQVTYAVVGFAARVGGVHAHAQPLAQLLASLRAQRPAL